MERILKNIMHKTFIFTTLFIILRIWVENETANKIIVKLMWTNIIIFVSATLYLSVINLVKYLLDD